MINEDKCLREIAKGSQDALKDLYDEYSTKVYNTIISYTKNTEDAQEVLQDVFLSVFETSSKFQFNSSVSTWIYRITINKSLDFLRKKNSVKRKGIFTSLFRNDTQELLHDPADFVHPGVKLENAEDAKLLFRVIDELSENQKTAFILTQIDGLSQLEAADIMEVSRKSVESLLQRAKANLRGALKKYYPERGKKSTNTSK